VLCGREADVVIRPGIYTETPSLPSAGAAAWLEHICDDSLAAIRKVHSMGGDFVAYDKGGDLTLFAFAPEHNRAVFSDPDTYHMFGPPGPRGSSQRRLSLGLLGLSGQQHVRRRRLVMPAVRKEAVEAYQSPLTEMVEQHLERWQAGQVVDLADEVKALARKVTGIFLLYGQADFPRGREITEENQRWVDAQVRVTLAGVLPVEAPARSYEAWLDHGATLGRDLRHLLRERRAALRPGDRDLLALFLQEHDQGRLSEDDVLGEVHTMVNAAYQTTASSLTWMLLLLALHPDVARDLVDELQSGVAPAPGQSLLECVIKESLRVVGPGVFTIRQTTRPAQLGALKVPVRTIVLLSFFVTHHMPSLFAEPDRFIPERWRTLAPSPYAYFPFGAGPRLCLGIGFAQQMMRIVIATVMRRFRLSLAPGTRVDRHGLLIMNVRDRLPMTVHLQDGRFSHTPVVGNIHEMVDLPRATAARRAA